MNTFTRFGRQRPPFTFIHLLPALALVVGLGALPGNASARIGQLPKDTVANYKMRSLDGHSYSLSTLRGEVVVLDFFTTWCGHSKLHIQTVKKLHEEGGVRGLKVVGLAVEETEGGARHYVADQGIGYVVATVTDPVFGSFVESRNVSVPQTLVYGRDGRLAGHFIGHSPELAAELASTVRRELEKR